MGEELPKDDAVADSLKDLLLVDGQPTGDILVVLEHLIHVLGKGLAFRVQNSVVGSSFSFHPRYFQII